MIDAALKYVQSGVSADLNAVTWGNPDGLPDWLKTGSYTREQLSGIMTDHVHKVMMRFKGKFKRVIVVNEPWGNPWASSFWTDKLGLDNYVVTAFRTARQADPRARLAANDFSIEFSGKKADDMFNLVKRLNEQEMAAHQIKLIDSVGFQSPLLLLNGVPGQGMSLADFASNARRAGKMEELRRNIERYQAMGVEVFVSEMFVDLTDVSGSVREKRKLQAAIYHDFYKVCRQGRVSVTTYGFHNDPQAYPEGAGRPNADPFPLDVSYNKKPAYFAILSALLPD